MSRRPSVPEPLQRGPFTRELALRHITPAQLRHATYHRLTRGVYMVGRPTTHGHNLQAAHLVLPRSAVFIGRSALWALGVPVAGPTDRVEVFLPADHRIRRRDLLDVSSERLRGEEVATTAVGLATTAVRTAFDLARLEDPLVAVPLLDALVQASGIRREHVVALMANHPGARWLSRVTRTLDLVDKGAESVRESRLRVILVRAGLPRPVTQLRIYNAAGEFVARVDLAWPELKVAVEYDGAHHDGPEQIARDRARINALRAAGWTVLVIDRRQLARPTVVVELVRRVLMDAAARS
ncbi:DUF559 domain-containing protein [Georgenia yuyongxinii]|uniref:DUF559 domain-containing protein n=1 Tax=Georgenia yuyongxinii TaxID=2589797 RepID=UPI00163DD050|nr:DUF559 domain-containing protein [Georgenia yuyongxinii]